MLITPEGNLADASTIAVIVGYGLGKQHDKAEKQTKLIICINRKFTNIEPSKVFKKAKILFFCMIFVIGGIVAQTTTQKVALLSSFKKPANATLATLSINNTALVPIDPKPFLSANYYASHLGFFCKQEIKFEKVAKIPIKFRLGSVEECDRMEGKQKLH